MKLRKHLFKNNLSTNDYGYIIIIIIIKYIKISLNSSKIASILLIIKANFIGPVRNSDEYKSAYYL